MNDDGRTAVFVGTFLADGDSVSLCDECMVPFAAALLHAMTGVDPTPFLQAVSDSEVTVEQVENAEAADSSPAAGDDTDPPPQSASGGRSRPVSPAAGTDTAPVAGDPPADGSSTPTAA